MEYNQDEAREFQEWKLNHEHALAVHAHHRSTNSQMLEAGLSFALEAIRTAVLVNGGAVVAMAAFIGATYNAPADEVGPVRVALLFPAFLFAIGAMLAGLASGCAYFTQLMYQEAAEEHSIHWQQPFVRETEASKAKTHWGIIWHVLGVVFVLGSYAFLGVGLFFAYHALV